jgi:hypothetical protein
MKKVIPAILLFIFFHSIIQAQTVNERIQVLENNGVNFVFKVQVSLKEDSALVGNAVSRVLFNPSILEFPENPKLSIDYSFPNFNSVDYLSSVSQPSEGTISINLINKSENSLMLSDEFVDIATLKFRANRYIVNIENALKGDFSQFFEPLSASIWNTGSFSISSLSEDYIPIPLSPFTGTIINDNFVIFNWQKIEGADYYHLEVALDESFKQLVSSVDNIPDTNLMLKHIVDGTKYYWRVRSVTSGDKSHFSNNSSFITATEKPSELNSLSEDQYVELTWTNNSQNAEMIVIERKLVNSKDSTKFIQIDTVSAGKSSYRDIFVEENRKYSYRIFAINDVALSDYCNSTSITTSIKVQKEGNNQPKDFELQQNYPNPFNPQTTIKYSVKENSHISVTIYSLLGEKIRTLVDKSQEAGNYDVIWNASNYPSGIYIYIMTAESRVSKNTFQNVKKMILLK